MAKLNEHHIKTHLSEPHIVAKLRKSLNVIMPADLPRDQTADFLFTPLVVAMAATGTRRRKKSVPPRLLRQSQPKGGHE